ncbi:uncharacterized protein LOC110927682 [Helianthus annuus]|uniref:uncharacterized protein LOC110927682 n=1 Tax=Helianthus annuus TaxID=4232 RepID=UPI001652DC22|nr:uncharacterized protein LOC110927682 [Helianthus annuus]
MESVDVAAAGGVTRSKRLVARWKRKKRLLSDFNKVKEDLNNAIDGLKERVLSDIDKVKEDLNNAIDGVREMVLSDDDAAVGVTRSKILLTKPKSVGRMETAKARLNETALRYDPNIAKKTVLSDEDKGKEDLNIAVDGGREMVLSDDKKDEEDVFNGAVDKLCKGILDYISSPTPIVFSYFMDFPEKPRLDARGSSGFLAFSRRYKLKFDKFMKSYSRVGIYPKKDVLPDDAKACSVAMLADEYVLERYKNFKRFDIVVDHSDHLFSSSPMEQASRRH